MGTVMGTFIRAGEASTPLQSFSESGAFQPGFTLDIIGLDASNTVKLQKSTNQGISWTDVSTLNSEQVAQVITEATDRLAQHRLLCLAKQAITSTGVGIQYKMSRELPVNRNTPPG
jgi:hypothetical protein